MPATLLHAYAGPFTQEAVVASGQALRALPGLSDAGRHRLFAVFVELAQNIGRYSAERAGPPGSERGAGLVEVFEDAPAGRLAVVATNLVAPDSAAHLAARLAALADLDSEGLKKLHRERRRSAPPPGSLGAGLGLIELARHAAKPPACATGPAPAGLVRLSLSVSIAA